MTDTTFDSDPLAHIDTMTRSAVSEGDVPFDPRIPGLTLLAHPDLSRIGERALLPALSSGRPQVLSRLEPLFAQPRGATRRPLADLYVSRKGLLLEPTPDGGVTVRNDSKIRATVDGAPLTSGRRWTRDDLDEGVILVLADQIALLVHFLEPDASGSPDHGLVGHSPVIQGLRRRITQVARLDVPVLVRGETGTGKELTAQAIHGASSRADGPFVAINMGAVPPSLAAAELFGAVKGAFTGADHRRLGFFARADGGTLFLDEIGETPLEVQAMLLRTLETGLVQAVGADKLQPVDVRIIAATDVDLDLATEQGRFRAPLLHRLAGFELTLPPLRRRRDDIPRLLDHFLRQEQRSLATASRPTKLSLSVLTRLSSFDWPGNVRQLRNAARQILVEVADTGECRALPPGLEAQLGLAETGAKAQEIDSPPPGVTPTAAPAASTEARSASTEARSASSAPSKLAAGGAETGPVLRTLVAVRWRARGSEGGADLEGSDLGAAGTADRSRRERIVRRLLAEYGGYELEKRGGFLLLFKRPIDAVGFALECQESLADIGRGTRRPRIGLFLGEVLERRNAPEDIARGARPLEAVGSAGPRAASLASVALEGQILMNRSAHDLVRQTLTGDHPLAGDALRWLEHGTYRCDSRTGPDDAESPGEFDLVEVGLEGLSPLSSPDLGTASAAAERASYRSPQDVTDDELLDALRRHAFRLQPTAKALGISRTSLYALIDNSSRIRKAKDLRREEIEAQCRLCGDDLDAVAAALEVSRKGLRRRMTQLGL